MVHTKNTCKEKRNAVTTHNPSQNRKLMGEGAKKFFGGVVKKSEGFAFGDINQFLQLKQH